MTATQGHTPDHSDLPPVDLTAGAPAAGLGTVTEDEVSADIPPAPEVAPVHQPHGVAPRRRGRR